MAGTGKFLMSILLCSLVNSGFTEKESESSMGSRGTDHSGFFFKRENPTNPAKNSLTRASLLGGVCSLICAKVREECELKSKSTAAWKPKARKQKVRPEGRQS